MDDDANYYASSASSAGGGFIKRATLVLDVDESAVKDEEMLTLYKWLDTFRFSKSRKTSANRDFADGVMMAELVAYYIPRIINARYYIPTSAISKKVENWEHLNSKVFKRIGFQLTPELIKELASGRFGMIEKVLKALQPILFKGSRAVHTGSKKLDNIKPRFLDFEKNYLRKRSKSARSSGSRPTTSSRPHSANNPIQFRARTPPSSSRRSSFVQTKPPSSAPQTGDGEHEVIQTPRQSRSTTRRSQKKVGSMAGPTSDPEKKYEIFTSQSTGIDNEVSPNSTDPILQKDQLDRQTDNDNEENIGAVVSINKPRFAVRSTWLPVDGEELSSNRRGYSTAQDVISPHKIENANNEEEVDEEIFCDQSGYEEDTEDEASGITTDEENCYPSSVDRNGNERRKRKVKRVVKYEYREEFFLNGMDFQLPNSQQIEKVRRNYINPGNKDTNCRGYGFV